MKPAKTIGVYRGEQIESSHTVHVFICDDKGHEIESHGNPEHLTFPRSAIKMLQAVSFVESGALEKYQLTEPMIALASASHHGEKIHVQLVSDWMQKIQVDVSIFHCGPHYPYSEKAAHEMIRQSEKPQPVHNNCSGKHLGIVSTCLALNQDPQGYYRHDHFAQVRLRKSLSSLMDLDFDKAPWGVDGCGIPTYAVPLKSLAVGLSHFFRSEGAHSSALQRIFKSCFAHPEFVSGTGAFPLQLYRKSEGKAFIKSGAEGTYCGLLPEKGISFAIKTLDGNDRASRMVAAQIFAREGAFSSLSEGEVKEFTEPVVKNTRNEVVGTLKDLN